MPKIFYDIDFRSFWERSDWADKEYVEPYPTAELIQSVEEELGYKLPASYIELMQSQNGGCPANGCHRTASPTLWAKDHVALTGFKGIGRRKIWSLCGQLGSQQANEEWGYPTIGIYFGDCPSAGHDMLCLDYRECGPIGEPKVVHIDQECDYNITFVAENFESFVRGLKPEDAFGSGEEVGQISSAWIDANFLAEHSIDAAKVRSPPWWAFWRR